MAGFILGQKSEQSQRIDEAGIRIPVTFISTQPCYLVDIKKPEVHNYFALSLGFGQKHTVKKSIAGTFKKAGIKTPLRFLREFRLEKYTDSVSEVSEEHKSGLTFGEAKIFIGDECKANVLFKKGDKVDISGISKGKGFAGGVKRHGFAGGPKTHGQSDRWRAPGSIGQTTTPGRVLKGKRMAGRMGGVRVTVKNLEIVEAREDGLLVKGLVPGHRGILLEVKSAK